MDLNTFFSLAEALRAERTLRNIALHNVSRWAITGGLAIEIHLLQHGVESLIRPLHDIDFMASSFGAIPDSLGKELLLRHVHPHDPPGRNMLQGVDPATQVRIDVFRAYGLEMERIAPVTVAGLRLRMVSLEDLIARHARLNWDLLEGNCVAPKFARDFLRMIDLVAPMHSRAYGRNIGNHNNRRASARRSCNCARQSRPAPTCSFLLPIPPMCARFAGDARRSTTSRSQTQAESSQFSATAEILDSVLSVDLGSNGGHSEITLVLRFGSYFRIGGDPVSTAGSC